jgi:hypothetical protein
VAVPIAVKANPNWDIPEVNVVPLSIRNEPIDWRPTITAPVGLPVFRVTSPLKLIPAIVTGGTGESAVTTTIATAIRGSRKLELQADGPNAGTKWLDIDDASSSQSQD